MAASRPDPHSVLKGYGVMISWTQCLSNINTCALTRGRCRRPNIDSRQEKRPSLLKIFNGIFRLWVQKFWNNDCIVVVLALTRRVHRTARNRLSARPFPVLITALVCRSTMSALILPGPDCYLFNARVCRKRRDFGFIASDHAGCIVHCRL